MVHQNGPAESIEKEHAMATLSGGALGDGAPLEATQDALFGGSVVLFQPQRGAGYRTNVDALLLAGFAAMAGTPPPHASALTRTGPRTTPRAAPVVFDLGAGVGAVGLALLRFGAAKRVVFVEIDEQPAAMARRNLDANGWTERGEVVRGDVRDVALSRRGEATLVVCNPPYIAPGRGRARARAAEARARSGELGAFVEAARQVAGRRARTCFVYPAHDLALLIATLAAEGLHAKRMRFVHSTPEAPARVVLVEAQAARPGGLGVMPPLVERAARGYTPEMAALLARG
jgi:tRNA1Val (adenine37-N6)-methyltransferase